MPRILEEHPYNGALERIERLGLRLRDAIITGEIDVGILVVPTNRLSRFLTDRAPSIAVAIRHVRAARADDLPLLLIALEHDGPGEALAKQRKRS